MHRDPAHGWTFEQPTGRVGMPRGILRCLWQRSRRGRLTTSSYQFSHWYPQTLWKQPLHRWREADLYEQVAEVNVCRKCGESQWFERNPRLAPQPAAVLGHRYGTKPCVFISRRYTDVVAVMYSVR